MYKKILITILSLLCLCSNPVYAEDVIEQPVAPPIETVVETENGEDNTVTVEKPKTEVDVTQSENEEVNKEDTVEDNNTNDSVQVENKNENTDSTENVTDDSILFEERIDTSIYYEWSIHPEIDFGKDKGINQEVTSKGNRVNVSQSVLPTGAKLIIKVKGSGENDAFTISNEYGNSLNYIVSDTSKDFQVNNTILELSSDTNSGYKDLDFKLKTTNNNAEYAGTYSGKIFYVAEIKQPPVINKDENVAGYYADVDGDGVVDGIIFADLAVGGSGEWNPSGESWAEKGTYFYNVIPADELKNYSVVQESYSGSFGTKPVLSPSGSGKDRFYVMALEDIDGNEYTWYNASGYMDDYYSTTSPNFGAGRTNTTSMINKWKNKAYGEQNAKDLWGKVIGDNWFVPSKMEWSAFAGNLGVTSSNYTSFGLSKWYWSSTQDSVVSVSFVNFGDGCMGNNTVDSSRYVRLATTF